MNHLTIDEILEFVSFNEINDETIALASKVNGHIKKCNECMKLVKSFQLIHDEMISYGELEYLNRVSEFVRKRDKVLSEKEKIEIDK